MRFDIPSVIKPRALPSKRDIENGHRYRGSLAPQHGYL